MAVKRSHDMLLGTEGERKLPHSMLLRFSEFDESPADIEMLSALRNSSKHGVALQALRLGLKVLKGAEYSNE